MTRVSQKYLCHDTVLMTLCHERQRAILRTRPGFPGPNTPNLEKILLTDRRGRKLIFSSGVLFIVVDMAVRFAVATCLARHYMHYLPG